MTRLRFEDGDELMALSLADERRSPRQQLVEHDSEAPQIAAGVDRLPARLLR